MPWRPWTRGPVRAPRAGRWCRSTRRGRAPPWRRPGPAPSLRSLPHDGDGFPGVHQDRVAGLRGYQGDADLFFALAGVNHGEAVVQQPHHGYLDGGVGAGDADVAVTLGDTGLRDAGHATTPGASTPGCSKKTCTSSHST